MVSKDQSIGIILFVTCFLIAIGYIVTLFYPQLLSAIGTPADIRFGIIAFPVLIAVVAIMAIGAWIGWAMATTPPPKPIEEITSEIEEKEETNLVAESETSEKEEENPQKKKDRES